MINETTEEIPTESNSKRRRSESVFRFIKQKLIVLGKGLEGQHEPTTFRYTRLVACRRGTKGSSAACVRLQPVCPRFPSGTWQDSELHKGHSTFGTMHNKCPLFISAHNIFDCGRPKLETGGRMKFAWKAKAWPARHAFPGPDWGVMGSSDRMQRCN